MEHRQIKLLPFHPPAPVPHSVRQKRTRTKLPVASNQFASRIDRVDVWNIALKDRIEELQNLLAIEQKANLAKSAAIECLHQNIRQKNTTIISLKKDCEKNEEKLCWLKHRCKLIHKTILATKNAGSQTEKLIKTIEKVEKSTSPIVHASQINEIELTFRSIGEFHETDKHLVQSNQLDTFQISQTEPLIDVELNVIKKKQSTDGEHAAMQVDASSNQTLYPQVDEMIMLSRAATSDKNEYDSTPSEIHIANESTHFATKLNSSPVINRSTTINHQSKIQMPLSDHTYAMRAQIKKGTMVYRCDQCLYWTGKKSSMIDHLAEFCATSATIDKRDLQCPGCPKKFSRRGLRLHLNYYKRSQKTHTKAKQ